jgi:hypothetical protein
MLVMYGTTWKVTPIESPDIEILEELTHGCPV